MKKVFVLVLLFNFILVHAQDKVVTKNGKEVEVNKDASTTSKGVVKLAGDLGGTADLPTVPGLATKQDVLTLTTTGTGAATLTGATLNIPTPSAGSPFTLQGTATDAGTDKTSVIDRTGSIEVKSGYLKAIANGNAFTIDPTDGGGPRLKLGPTATPSGYFEIGAYNSINNFDTKSRDLRLFSSASPNAFYIKNDTGNIGIGTNNPISSFSNAAAGTNFVSSNNSVQGSKGIAWAASNTGYVTSLYNSNNVLVSNGLQVKVANNSNSTIAFEVGQNTSLIGTSTPLFNVLGNGNVGVGISSPNSKFEVINTSLYSGTESDTHGIQLSTGKTNTDYTLYMGADKTNNTSYLQSVKWSVGMAPLVLNGRGGNVGIGTPTPQTLVDMSPSLGSSSLTIGTAGTATGEQVNINFATKYNRSGGMRTAANKGWQIGARGNAWSSVNQQNALYASYWTGTTDITAFTILQNGNMGVGPNATVPTSQLEVDGAATNKIAFNAAAGTTIDFTKSNLAYTTANAGAFTLSGMKDGGTYTLAVQGTTAGTLAPTGNVYLPTTATLVAGTFKSINNGATTAGKQTLYTFIVMGSTVYYYMATGF